jgi:hypothetical protein
MVGIAYGNCLNLFNGRVSDGKCKMENGKWK